MLIFWKKMLIPAKLKVYFLKLHICVYLRIKCPVSSKVLTRFRQGVVLTPLPQLQNKPMKSSPILGLIWVKNWVYNLERETITFREEMKLLYENMKISFFQILFLYLHPWWRSWIKITAFLWTLLFILYSFRYFCKFWNVF